MDQNEMLLSEYQEMFMFYSRAGKKARKFFSRSENIGKMFWVEIPESILIDAYDKTTHRKLKECFENRMLIYKGTKSYRVYGEDTHVLCNLIDVDEKYESKFYDESVVIFPQERLDTYTRKLEQYSIDYEIIDYEGRHKRVGIINDYTLITILEGEDVYFHLDNLLYHFLYQTIVQWGKSELWMEMGNPDLLPNELQQIVFKMNAEPSEYMIDVDWLENFFSQCDNAINGRQWKYGRYGNYSNETTKLPFAIFN